jgi:hypothetical protein
MNTSTKSTLPAGLMGAGPFPAWAPLALGLLLMYVPSFLDMFQGLWSTEEQAHGPMIFGISLWLIYRNWGQMLDASEGDAPSWLGWPLLVLTLVQLPRLDRQQHSSAWFAALDAAGVMRRVDPVERRDLPSWLVRRLAAQGQRVEDGETGQRTLAFFARHLGA